MPARLQKIFPHLWYTKDAAAAATFYAAIFPDSRVDKVTPIPIETPSGPPGTVDVVDFTLFGQRFQALSAGPLDPFNHAVSFVVLCDDQQELDRYWNGLLAGGGKPEMCGWLKDKFGVVWQVVPKLLDEADLASERGKRVATAMLKMQKLDIATLQAAADGR